MVSIEIDEEVFNYLKSLAEPFVDTPNTVLRRILFPAEKSAIRASSIKTSTASIASAGTEPSSEEFVNAYLRNRYGEQFRTKAPFRTMFESEKHLIYFQNFNKAGTNNLWYRLSESSLNTLRNTPKTAFICLTNPSDDLVLEIPVKDIDDRIAKKKWNKDFLEVNIDPASLRWRELDWNLEQYRIKDRL